MSRAPSTPNGEALKAGDLVMVSRVDHDCATVLLGRIYTFQPLLSGPGIRCQKCGTRDVAKAGELVHSVREEHGVPARWLRRIPPLSELEGERTKEDLREPA